MDHVLARKRARRAWAAKDDGRRATLADSVRESVAVALAETERAGERAEASARVAPRHV